MPVLILASYLIGTHYGHAVLYVNLVFISAFFVSLIVFHFKRDRIEDFALFSQLVIVVLTSIKVYLMGGMANIGTPVFVGFIAPVYALTLPNKKRAIIIFLLFTSGMITATLLNPNSTEGLIFPSYFLGFIISSVFIFITLFYFTTQLDKARKAEKERVKKIDELKTRFYTHITHEFRTPLSIISGMSDQMKAKPDQWLNEGHAIIKRNCSNLVSLTNRLLDLSKLESNAMPVNMIQDDLALYLKYICESFQSYASTKNIDIHFESVPDEIIMDFDPDKIRDIFSNLISNAIKFTPNNGRIKISADVRKGDEGDYAILKIEDTGIGIPKGQLNQIFNRYFQANNQLDKMHDGTGIGLALTNELVKLLKGTISVDSATGKGSVFTIRLPISRNAELLKIPESIEKNQSDSIGSRQSITFNPSINSEQNERLTVLVIDDNTDVVLYLKSILLSKYKIEVAENGRTGLEKACELIPDLIVSDIMMPEIDGYALCSKLKQDIRTSHIPIIMLTARADHDSKMTGLSVGADAYLEKPFNPDELIIRIEKLVELRKSLQEYYRKIVDDDLTAEQESNSLTKEDEFIRNVREILLMHLSEESFGIEQLCKNMAMSRSQLYRKFSALTDTTVHQYIMTLKLNKAQELLLNTNLNVTEVAYDTGFKNISHFSRAFRERFGYPPSKEKISS
ncbi:MAG: response regulator [Flavobacteriaceae bacterium]|nr:response regulator [Flavobacteriaceae bacterium]